jgi:hypothetical protein
MGSDAQGLTPTYPPLRVRNVYRWAGQMLLDAARPA